MRRRGCRACGGRKTFADGLLCKHCWWSLPSALRREIVDTEKRHGELVRQAVQHLRAGEPVLGDTLGSVPSCNEIPSECWPQEPPR